jgi:hypothetical protein
VVYRALNDGVVEFKLKPLFEERKQHVALLVAQLSLREPLHKSAFG